MIDTIYIPVLVLIAIIILGALYEVSYSLIDQLAATGLPFYASAKASFFQAYSALFYFAYFGIPIVGIILAYLFGGNKMLSILGIIFLVFGAFLNLVFKEVAVEMISGLPNALALFQTQPLNLMLEYFPLIMFLFGVMILIAQYIGREEF